MSAALRFVVTIVLLHAPLAAWAQGTAGISGTVKDATGGILPGVTVEASSPVLIERVRTVVTDGAGQYQIVSLPPGVYVVTFTLPGFTTVTREGVALTTGFNASINADLTIGSLQETIHVAGGSPLVDTQNVSRQEVLTREIVDALPTSKNYGEMAALIPGMSMVNTGGVREGNTSVAVGGAGGMEEFPSLATHGGRTSDQKFEINGLNINTFALSANTFLDFQDGTIQEYSYEMSGHSAESESGGVRINVIPKEGGNQYRGFLFTNFATGGLQSSNLTDEIRAAGLLDADRLDKLWSLNASTGGPIMQNKIWFYGGYGRRVATRYKAGMYDNTTPAAWRPTFDLSRPAIGGDRTDDASIRVTWQAAPRHKISFHYGFNRLCQCPYYLGTTFVGTRTHEATWDSPRYTHLRQVTWTAPLTTRLLLEAGGSIPRFETRKTTFPEMVAPGVLERSLGTFVFRAPNPQQWYAETDTNNTFRGAMSYVTGTHATKLGATVQFGSARHTYNAYQNIFYNTLNWRPVSVSYYATPYYPVANFSQVGVFGQDQWRLQRLTLSLGVRYDFYAGGYPDVHLPATQYAPTVRDFPAARVLEWQDLSPRLGVAYDLFGNGRTAVKASWGRYLVSQGRISGEANPSTANMIMTRQWTDPNGDFIVQGDPFNPEPNGELGRSQNRNFGQQVLNNNYDPDFAKGFGVRPYNWEGSLSLSHEISSGMSATVGYFRRWYGNFQISDNVLVGPTDYDHYCVAAPADPRLPGNVRGEQLCGFYDLRSDKVGLNQQIITTSTKYGKQIERFDGIDVSARARLPLGGFVNGGLSTGKTTTDNCDVVTKLENPSTQFCRSNKPFVTQVKVSAAYTLPWNVQIAATLQSLPGTPITANASFTNDQIRPSLGRNLSSGSTATIALIEPNTIFHERINQVDMRVAKTVRVGMYTLKMMADVYNLTNINTITTLNVSYGTDGGAWLRPQGIMIGRFAKFGMQIDF